MKDESPLVRQRQDKADALRSRGENPYANDFSVTHIAADLHRAHLEDSAETLEATPTDVAVAGRVMAVRTLGKVVFAVLSDYSGRIQANVFKNMIPEEDWARLELLDVGDIVGVTGQMMRTRRGELSIRTRGLRILTKSIQPLPEKWHGLTDVATRYRQRYLDLITNSEVRETFRMRSRIISYVRRFLDDRSYLEVETPVLQALYGGAAARPFTTHHNAQDMDLFLRIAPELYLKRLVVGGFDRVYELARCFRNEGLSTQHNPEFTLLEFYQAFATYQDLIELTEELINGLCVHLHGGEQVQYGEQQIDFARPFARISVLEGLTRYAQIPEGRIDDHDTLVEAAVRFGLKEPGSLSLGRLQMEVFEAAAEHEMIQPTFVTDHPLDVSPLARKKPSKPSLVDRFELFVAGRELANGFSELNDPVDQRDRFAAQVAQRAAGDDEAHPMDEDYIRALEHGMPPAAGEGIGIDRLVMLMTGAASIRDVILFPLLRPEA